MSTVFTSQGKDFPLSLMDFSGEFSEKDVKGASAPCSALGQGVCPGDLTAVLANVIPCCWGTHSGAPIRK